MPLEIINIENTLPNINLRKVLLGFAETPTIVTKREVLEILEFAGISEERIESTIDVLHDLTFLGREVDADRFVFSDTPEDSEKNKILAQKFAWKKGLEERFQIHKAFRAFLETEEI